MKSRFLTLLLLLFCGSISAQSKIEIADFTRELAAKSGHVETIICDFTETRHMDILADDIHRQGKFSYKRPEQILLLFASGDRIVMTPNNFAMSMDGRTINSKISSNPMLRQMQSVFTACMTGDVEKLLAGGEMLLTRSDQGYELRYIPSARSAQKYVSSILLIFDHKDMTLSELRMNQPSGDFTLYRFTNKRFNTAVDDSIFSIK